MSNAMKERLVHEASLLSSKQHMASLIIDEASIKQKCIYDRKADAVFGLKDKPESSMANTAKEALANRVLCFVLHGTTSRYKIPCSYYFTKQLSGRDLFAWTKEVIAAVESCGFIIVRIVTNNYSANVTMFKHMDLRSLLEYEACPSPSVTFSGLAYLGGYIAKLITDLGCDSCAALLTTNNREHPLYKLLRAQDRSELQYPRPEFLALLDKIVVFFDKASEHLPRRNVLEVLETAVQPYLQRAPILSCPEGVDDSHSRRSADLIAEKFLRILLVNHTNELTDANDKPSIYAHKPTRKHFRL
ncbi:hypothetical protein MTO96_036463 [Rhipicephalus appendiculatus]